MRRFAILLLALSATTLAKPQGDGISFGGSSSSNKATTKGTTSSNPEVGERLGLIASQLGRHPTGGNNGGGSTSGSFTNGNQQQQQQQKGRQSSNQYCCCTRRSTCPQSEFDYYDDDNNGDGGDDYYDYSDDDDYTGINPRVTNQNGKQITKAKDDIVTRIVNNPGSGGNSNTCSSGSRRCCYNSRSYRNSLSSTCSAISNSGSGSGGNGGSSNWNQNNCRENIRTSGSSKTCGQRNFNHARGLARGEASPEEFPWTCLILDGSNNFVGTCAIIPEDFDNNISRGTKKVITAAHKLDAVKGNDLLKIRVLEYDASSFKNPERTRHIEFTVIKITKHPRYKPKRFTNDIAVLTVDKTIDLTRNDGVNAACLQQCDNMFDHKFNNGTGTRCWVAGWGKDAVNGNFKNIMHKVDVPIYDRNDCESALKGELRKTNAETARRFNLDQSELCAGGEVGKDACDGDGGAPLVCQSESRRWYVVGLVTWGVNCAQQNVPGVYARISHFKSFIENN